MAVNQAVDWDDLKLRLLKMKSAIEAKPVFRWGIITNANPLLVQLDGDDRPIAGSPSTIIGGLSAGERVLCMVQNRRVTVTGRGGEDSSGFISVPYTSGCKAATVSGGDSIAYMVRDGWVTVSGGGTNSRESMAAGSLHHMATLPGRAWPERSVRAGCDGSVGKGGRFVVLDDGRVFLGVTNNASSNASWLVGTVSYPLRKQ